VEFLPKFPGMLNVEIPLTTFVTPTTHSQLRISFDIRISLDSGRLVEAPIVLHHHDVSSSNEAPPSQQGAIHLKLSFTTVDRRDPDGP
jgi:hypothetical protein